MARMKSADSRSIRFSILQGMPARSDQYNMEHHDFIFPVRGAPLAQPKSGKARQIRPLRLGVVIPCRGDADLLHPCLVSLGAELGRQDRAVVVNSTGDRFTAAIARQSNFYCLTPPNPARGLAIAAGVVQIFGNPGVNQPAAAARFSHAVAAPRPDLLLIAHADMVFPRGWRRRLESAMAGNPELGWGAFGHVIADARIRFRLLEAGNTWRAAYWHIPFGDQAMFLRSRALHSIGGFPIQEKYEDLELALRLKEIGPPLILDCPVTTGARHWRGGSSLRTFRNWCILAGYRAGWLKPGPTKAWSVATHQTPVFAADSLPLACLWPIDSNLQA